MSADDHLHRGNLLWEGSRMMLPEHKEALLKHRRKLGDRPRPELDEQLLQELSETLAAALAERSRIALRLYAPGDDETLEGVVMALSPERRAVKLGEDGGGWRWVALADIVGAAPLD